MTDIQKDDIEILVGLDAITSAYTSLGDAVQHLVSTLRETEDKKLVAARIVQTIERQELYREAGCNSMSEFYPLLLEQTASVGWNAERTVRAWVAFASLYLDKLKFDERTALKANSHLHTLYTLADVDRKSGELRTSTENEKKLDAIDFTTIAKVVTALAVVPSAADKENGRSEAETQELLLSASLTERQLERFTALVGYAPFIPEGGWAVSHTRTLIEAIRGEEDKTPKAKQIWYLSFQDEDRVEVERIAWEINDEEIKSIDWHTLIERSEFDAMSKGDRVVDCSEGKNEG